MSNTEHREPRSHDYPTCTSHPVEDGTMLDDKDFRRVIITWPAATTSGALPIHGVTVEDADTGEQIVSGFKLVLGTDTSYEGTIVEAEITALVDEDGTLLPAGKQPVITEDYARHRAAAPDKDSDAFDEHEAAFEGQLLRTAVFRYAVAEMRVKEA